MNFDERVAQFEQEGKISSKNARIIKQFHYNYVESLKVKGVDTQLATPLFETYLKYIIEQTTHPLTFEPYHKKVTAPFDFYQFGLDFFGHLLNRSASHVFGRENIRLITSQLAQGDNVILFSNHQSEADPQLISLMLDGEYPGFARDMIFVAGDRVVTDPIAVPMSIGRDLLCIHSKKHVDNPPELKETKLQHNQKTMKRMTELLKEGGKCIYVAPSGGRDRPNEVGEVPIAPFDPQSVEMFILMSQQAKTPTHFYPLALTTFDLLPPPVKVEKELGEERRTAYSPVGLAFGKEILISEYPGKDNPDKKARRVLRAEYLWSLVNDQYQLLKNL